ncbi:hypothetical protein QJS10_CPA03g00451 [Acorus calamus]|uniref:Pentatricopeptide repeat-containing protein n=1 Tax=Acorus calamus TaxID=4465 RepID=A0AAV9FDI1_ACOCL|nr:hypothetical protein QJS10_CPA03g00451 [Acorus calamus]
MFRTQKSDTGCHSWYQSLGGVHVSMVWDTGHHILPIQSNASTRGPPSVVIYNTLIGFLSNERAVEVKHAMKWSSAMTRPNAVTYALLMERLCVREDYRATEKMVFDMEYRECKPDAMNYGVLMNDHGRAGISR